MRGMGALFSMYGQAGGATEAEAAAAKAELDDITRQISMEKNSERREKLENMKIKAMEKYAAAKDKMKNLLRGVATTASQAAASLSSGAKSVGSRLSASASSVGSRLSSSAGSFADKIKGKYQAFKDNRADKRYQNTIAELQRKKDSLAQFRGRKSPSPSIMSDSNDSDSDTGSIVTSDDSN
jgi:hypothetical protein